jgi:hypothetical protein
MDSNSKTTGSGSGDIGLALALLVKLQMMDHELDRARADLARIPSEIAIAEEELEEAQREFSAFEKSLEAVIQSQRQCEKEKTDSRLKLAEYRNKLLSLKTNTEYKAMLDQISFVERAMDGLDSRSIELMYAEDGEREKLEAAKRKLERSRERTSKKKLILEERRADLAARIDRMQGDRAGLLPEINVRFLRKYEQLRVSGKANAVVELSRGACGGCLTNVPPQHAVEIEAGANYTCPICGRYIVCSREPHGTHPV